MSPQSAEIVDVPLHTLVLDPQNPRLVDPGAQSSLSQFDCARLLLDRHDPVSIARSLSTFDFFASDPLIGYADGDSVVVVEGNRRLLAVKLLVDEGLRDELSVDDEWDELAELASSNGYDFATLPVQLVANRFEAAPVIGFRHIVGIKRWGAWEKATFVRQLLDRQDDPDQAFEMVSRLTGERPARIRRYLRDFLVVRQAESAGLGSSKGARNEFGVFTRALNTAGISEYIQAVSPTEIAPTAERGYSAPDHKVEQVLGFLFGDDEKKIQPVLTDARRVQDLGRVLRDSAATEHLIHTRDLTESLAMTGAARERVLRQIGRAFAELSLAQESFPDLADDDLVIAALTDVRDLADALLKRDVERAAELKQGSSAGSDTGDYDLNEEDELDDGE